VSLSSWTFLQIGQVAQRRKAIRLRSLDEDGAVGFGRFAVLVHLPVTPTNSGRVILGERRNAWATLPELVEFSLDGFAATSTA
jgi:hypothetical protein